MLSLAWISNGSILLFRSLLKSQSSLSSVLLTATFHLSLSLWGRAIMSPDPKVYAFDEVAKHNQKHDCWLLISGKVYDVTPFLDDHPGGDEILLTASGKDATEEFDDIGHSDDARDMMKKYYIGEVDVSSIPTKPKPKPKHSTTQPSQRTMEPNQSSGFLVKLLQFLLPLAMLGLAFALQKFKKQD